MTRAELYELVWTTPMVRLAKEYGLSDVGLRKTCQRYDIPTPPLGYWAKLEHGKKVSRPELPPLKQGTKDQIHLVPNPKDGVPEAILALTERAVEHEHVHPIVVPHDRPDQLHKYAVILEKALKRAKPDDEGFLHIPKHNQPHYYQFAQLYIGANSAQRATLIFDTLFRSLEERGYTVQYEDDIFSILADGERMAFRMYEGKEKKAHIPSPQELKAQARRDEDQRRLPSLYNYKTKAYRTWDYDPSGRLSLEITNPAHFRWRSENLVGRWHDRKAKKLEDVLNEVMISIVSGAAEAKLFRAQKEEEEQRRLEEQRRREREAGRLQRAKKRHEFLLEKSTALDQVRKLEALFECLEADAGIGEERGFDLLVEELEETIAEKRRAFCRAGIGREIEQLGLYTEDDYEIEAD